MSLFSTLNTGVTGLSVNSQAMHVVGDNIANVNTVGFKASRISFQDMLAQNVMGSSGAAQLGYGTRVAGVSLNFAQGTFENSSNATDLAVNGQGFFVVRDPSRPGERLFTRDGQFLLDAEGNLVTNGGFYLQGYNADGVGNIGTIVEDIRLNIGIQAPRTTEKINVVANLAAETGIHTDPDELFDLTADNYEYSTLSEQADFSTSVTIYDSQGGPHEISVFYQKVGDNKWNWVAVANTSELEGQDKSDQTATNLMYGTAVFKTDGRFDSDNSTATPGSWGQFAGAEEQPLEFDFYDRGSLTQFGGQKSALSAISQDGYGPGYLSFIDIDSDGRVSGTYSNGQEQKLCQIALATFQSAAGLERRGGNILAATASSQEAAVGAPNTGVRGTIAPFSLELSNVDLENEFVKMISGQLGYQANSRVITTTNELMQQLINTV